MSLSYKILRRWHVFKLKLRERMETTREPLDPEQRMAIDIAKRVIVDDTSSLHFSNFSYETGEASRYLIENGHLVVKITHGKIRIINGKYKYDVSFRNEDKELRHVKSLFARSLAHRLDKMEARINARVEKSLDHILSDLKQQDE